MSKEARRIDLILKAVGRWRAISAAGIEPSVGLEALDDCAVVPMSQEFDLIIGSDFVRGTGFHLFRAGLLSFEDIGRYLIVANASDLAAMGAKPLGVVVVARYTADMTDGEFEAVMTGVAKGCAEYGMPLLGGDTGGYEQGVLSAAAFGLCQSGRALLRSAGREGEALFLTGTVGRAGAAIAYFTRGKGEGLLLDSEAQEGLVGAWRRPTAALAQGQFLVESKLSRCCIDTSDGLKAAVRQLGEASGVDVVLRAEAIPVDTLAEVVANGMAVDPLALAVSDSVDFRLVFSVARDHVASVVKAFSDHAWELYEIGELRASSGTPTIWLERDGGVIPLPGVEWDQGEIRAIDRLKAR